MGAAGGVEVLGDGPYAGIESARFHAEIGGRGRRGFTPVVEHLGHVDDTARRYGPDEAQQQFVVLRAIEFRP